MGGGLYLFQGQGHFVRIHGTSQPEYIGAISRPGIRM
jgi:hypothetical protein